jgi:hypothetical protein
MKGYAIVNGKSVSFALSRGLAAAHRCNAGRSMSASESIMNVEGLRRIQSLKHAGPYVETRN